MYTPGGANNYILIITELTQVAITTLITWSIQNCQLQMQSYIEPLQNAVLQIVFLNSLCRLIGDNEPWDWIWKCRWASVIESPTSRKLSLSNFFSPLKVRSTSNLAKLKGKHFHKRQQEKKVCALYVEYFDIEGLPYILTVRTTSAQYHPVESCFFGLPKKTFVIKGRGLISKPKIQLQVFTFEGYIWPVVEVVPFHFPIFFFLIANNGVVLPLRKGLKKVPFQIEVIYF